MTRRASAPGALALALLTAGRGGARQDHDSLPDRAALYCLLATWFFAALMVADGTRIVGHEIRGPYVGSYECGRAAHAWTRSRAHARAGECFEDAALAVWLTGVVPSQPQGRPTVGPGY